MRTAGRSSPVAERAEARVAEVARVMNERLTTLAGAVFGELAESIPELRGDPMILELLRASTEGNIETFLHYAQHAIPVEEIEPPTAAAAYARRLAQRGTSSNALLRAYRLGQRGVDEYAFAEIGRQEQDPAVAYLAAELMHQATFAYVDRVAELVVIEYEAERERWLANRNTVRAAMLDRVLAGEETDVAAAEAALGYRLGGRHIGLVLWDGTEGASAAGLRGLESLAAAIADSVGGAGAPLFVPRDGSLGWAWVPLGGGAASAIDVERLGGITRAAGGGMRVAMGDPAAGITGFRDTHRNALRTHAVAGVAADAAPPVTAYSAPGVRAAAFLAADLPAGRDLVTAALGRLAANDENAARLRETLLVFLDEGGSYLATGRRLHIHKNTVKYRIDKAAEARGRPADEDRFDLELALYACRWLGAAVLT